MMDYSPFYAANINSESEGSSAQQRIVNGNGENRYDYSLFVALLYVILGFDKAKRCEHSQNNNECTHQKQRIL